MLGLALRCVGRPRSLAAALVLAVTTCVVAFVPACSDPDDDPSGDGLDGSIVPVLDASDDRTRGDGAMGGFEVSAPSPSAKTTESGGKASFTVRLRSRPVADVTIAVASTKPHEGTADKTSLTFTPSTYDQPQTVTVAGHDDAVDDGDVVFAITLAPAVSTDASYAGVDPDDVALTNVDDDTAGLSVSAPAPSDRTTELGGQITFTVTLASQPLAAVTVPVVSSRLSEGLVSAAQLVFTPSDWSVPRTVTVTGQADGVVDLNQPYVVFVGATTSTDPLYVGLQHEIELVNTDDPPAPPCTPGASDYADVSAGQGIGTGYTPSALVDPVNGKLLVVTNDGRPNGGRNGIPALFRCNLDGTSCAYTDISAGQGPGSGYDPVALIDLPSRKLLVVTAGGNHDVSSLFRCNLDGTSCTYTDISVGQGPNSGRSPSALIDGVNRKLLVVTANSVNAPALFRCNLDGTACTHTDISAGQGPRSGYEPSASIDRVSGKLLVVTGKATSAATFDTKPALFRCNLDGTSCAYSDISAGQPGDSGQSPSVVIDTINSKLLVVTRNGSNSYKPSLFRCNLDGTSCVHTDISAGAGNVSGTSPFAMLDAVSAKLLVVTEDEANPNGVNAPTLFRCNLDGTSCGFTDISAGQGLNSGVQPSAVFDRANGRLLVVTNKMTVQPALFRACLP
jgi:hypothetical protein